MKVFDELVEVIEHLLSPNGCSWDREQTLQSIKPYLVEEIYEVVDAIDFEGNHAISEEIGDVFFQLVLLCKLAERDELFSLAEALDAIKAKLIYRHPHVFNEAEDLNTEEVLEQWEEIKKKEKAHRKTIFEDIPKSLPALARAQKMLKKFKKHGYDWEVQEGVEGELDEERNFAWALMALVEAGAEKGFVAENALLKELGRLERNYNVTQE